MLVMLVCSLYNSDKKMNYVVLDEGRLPAADSEGAKNLCYTKK